MMKTKRLILREMNWGDFSPLCKMLYDEEVMAAYEGAFKEEEVKGWMEKQLRRYEEYGYGPWAVILKETGEMIGQCGLTWQAYRDQTVLEVGYLLQKQHWHQGYALEAAKACTDYAFEKLDAQEVYALIRENNQASRKLAQRLGMTLVSPFRKTYRGVERIHVAYRIAKQEWEEKMLITTQRMNLRPAKVEDIPWIMEMENHPDNRNFIWQGTLQQHIDEIQDENHLLLIHEGKENGEKIGYSLSHLNHQSHVFELRRIAMAVKGKGYGQESMEALMAAAFEKMEINRFWLDVYPDNTAGIALYEKLGMHRDGMLRESYKSERGYLNQIIYSLLKGEWDLHFSNKSRT